MAGEKWTDERKELLTHLWCVERLTAAQIVDRLGGVTRNAVIGKVHLLGLSRTLAPADHKKKYAGPPKPRAERQAPVRQGMIRFGGGSIPKSVIPEKPIAPERPAANPVTLEERRADQCGWPVNEGGPYLYCGAFRHRHKRYCDRHAMAGAGKGRAA